MTRQASNKLKDMHPHRDSTFHLVGFDREVLDYSSRLIVTQIQVLLSLHNNMNQACMHMHVCDVVYCIMSC